MRRPDEMPPRRPPRRPRKRTGNRGRIALIVVFAVLVILFLSARGIAGFYTDYLWYDSLGYSEVWSSVLGAKIALAALFTTAFFVLLMLNLVLAGKLAPRFRTPGPEEEFIERYQQLVGRRTWLVNLAVSLVFALVAGVGVSGQWRDWILFTNRVDFGIKDEQFGLDVGFYVFQLPFLSFVVGWLFAAMVIIFIITTVAHYLNGGIRVQVPGQRVTPQVKAHLSVLLAVLALLKAAGYWLQRYNLTLSSRGTVDGATYTDVKAQLPAINLLVLISLGAAVLLVVNIWQRGWRLPVIAVGLWGVVAVVAGAIYPEIIQRFQVQPAESSREAPYIERNITATRAALGLNVETIEYAPQNLTTEDLASSTEQLESVRLLDPNIVRNAFQSREAGQSYYQFTDLDVDRYDVQGRTSQVVISARELNAAGLPQQSWVARHLAYTHGYGVEVAPADRVRTDGLPVFLEPTPDTPGPVVTQPGIYFGEDTTDYAVVSTNRTEISVDNQPTSYDGTGGVGMGSRIRRLAFALRFSEPNLLLSGEITGRSRILYVRDVRERVELLAPFLEFDADPYPVVLDGRVLWVVDGYTTTDRYPYAQTAAQAGTADSGLNKSFNYVRNSVKATVDAYDGTVHFYVVDETDPLAKAYTKQFPGVFEPRSALPAGLEAHFRYPEDLFRVQTSMWGRYHVDNPTDFYQESDSWNVAQDPSAETSGAATSTPRIAPFYGLMALPTGEGGSLGERQFILMRPFVPVSGGTSENRLLVSFMTASSDPGNYGKLTVFRLPSAQLPPGPSQVQSEIETNPAISSARTLLGQQGSRVQFGNQVLLPVGRSMIYVTPMYVESESQDQAPTLRRVIVSRADGQGESSSAIGNTLEQALEGLVGDAPNLGQVVDDDLNPTDVPPDTGTTTTTAPGDTTTTTAPADPSGSTSVPAPAAEETVESLLAKADAAFEAADTALQDGDLATYQAKVEEARQYVAQANLLATGTVPPTTTTTAPTTTPPGTGDA